MTSVAIDGIQHKLRDVSGTVPVDVWLATQAARSVLLHRPEPDVVVEVQVGLLVCLAPSLGRYRTPIRECGAATLRALIEASPDRARTYAEVLAAGRVVWDLVMPRAVPASEADVRDAEGFSAPPAGE